MHEPYRLPLIPGLEAALGELRKDARLLGSWLSGAGPTLASFAPIGSIQDLKNGEGVSSAVTALEKAGVPSRVLELEIDRSGLMWEEVK